PNRIRAAVHQGRSLGAIRPQTGNAPGRAGAAGSRIAASAAGASLSIHQSAGGSGTRTANRAGGNGGRGNPSRRRLVASADRQQVPLSDPSSRNQPPAFARAQRNGDSQDRRAFADQA